MDPETHEPSAEAAPVALAIILDGVPELWHMNVLQILGRLTIAQVDLDGYGTIEAPAIRLSQDQARHLSTQITELLGPEGALSPELSMLVF